MIQIGYLGFKTMKSKFNNFSKRFIYCLPLIIVTIGIFYFINLFERLYDRDLNRQLSERKQLMTLTESLSNLEDIKKSILTLDTFDNTYTYMLYDEGTNTFATGSKAEIYHSAVCPFVLKQHPQDLPKLTKQINMNKRGSFITKENRDKIIWEFRHFKVAKEPIDEELEIAIGLMLFITGILNWALVGFWKYKCSGSCLIKKD